MEGLSQSNTVTRKVTALTRVSWRAARWPNRAAVVIPPAHTPNRLRSSLLVISRVAFMASSMAAT